MEGIRRDNYHNLTPNDMAYYKNYKYTTEHINETDVLVKIYKGGKLLHKFSVCDYGDWNVVEDAIESRINNLKHQTI